MINIIVITHGEFGAYLIEAAEGIVGAQREGLRNVSISSRMTLEKVKETITRVMDDMKSPDGLVMLIDMPGGTPMNVALLLARDVEKCALICGVNINMMTSAFAYRQSLDFDRLVVKVMEDGRKAICEVKSLLMKK